ncbi:MAG: AI-2E family transporter [Deltaproteobacteria bacterium]|nr:AI-2E family transporter [Deltaproteobacteria bacterium]
MDRVANFLSEKTPRRFVALASFAGVLYLFRHLALLLVFFVTFERALGWSSRFVAAKTGLPRKRSLLVVLLTLVGLIGATMYLGIDNSIRAFSRVEENFPERLAALRENPLVARVQEHVGGTEKIVEGIKHYAGDALSAMTAIGHFFVYVLIAFILALVFVLEHEELETFWGRVDQRSLGGTIGRWLGHVADATVVTVQLQLIVAAFNTVTTLPVLLVLGVPHVGPLMLLVFVSALVPVIGNVVSGTVLSLLAYQAKGWLGVGIFVGLTFVLHKVESYYLSPRLTARHVKIPGFLLIVSLLACEHLFGLKGLFLSFPILFVGGRIRSEFLEEDAVISASPIVLTDNPDQLKRDDDLAADDGKPTGFELEREKVTLDSVRPPPMPSDDGEAHVVGDKPPTEDAPKERATSATTPKEEPTAR